MSNRSAFCRFVIVMVVANLAGGCSTDQTGQSNTPPPEQVASKPQPMLSDKRYKDPKGYFTIVPPSGWTITEYPDDPRGKVAFIAPKPSVDLRVLVNVVGYDSLDRLVDDLKSKESQLGVDMHIQKTKFGDIPAVKRDLVFRGLHLQLTDFLVGKVAHNIQFAAPPGTYEEFLPAVSKSIETYEPILKQATDADVLKSAVAKKLRLAQLMLEDGQVDLALDYVKEGLSIAPDHPELKKLEGEIQNRRAKP